MPYQSLPLNAIPKRKAPERKWSPEDANALLAVVSAPHIPVEGGEPTPPTATDGIAHADEKTARAEASKAKRLLAHVLPVGKIVKTVTFGLDKKGQPVRGSDSAGKYGWAVFLTDAPPAKAAAEAPATT